MKTKELTMKECMEIFKKYDKHYARYLMEKNKNQATEKNGENL